MSLPCRAHRRPQRGKSMKGNKPFRTKMTTVPFLFRSGTVFFIATVHTKQDARRQSERHYSTQSRETFHTAERHAIHSRKTASLHNRPAAKPYNRDRSLTTASNGHKKKVTLHHAKDNLSSCERWPSTRRKVTLCKASPHIGRLHPHSTGNKASRQNFLYLMTKSYIWQDNVPYILRQSGITNTAKLFIYYCTTPCPSP